MTPVVSLKKQMLRKESVAENGSGIVFDRYFTHLGTQPFDEIRWIKKSSVIKEPDGTVVFEMNDIEVPDLDMHACS